MRSAMHRHTIEVTEGQSFVRCQTLEMPARTELYERTDDYLVLKVPTHTFSSGQSRGHAVAAFYIFEIVNVKPVRGGEDIETDFLLSFPTRRK